MTKTITALYDTYPQAEDAVRRLEAAGVPHADISIAANRAGVGGLAADQRKDESATTADAETGGILGAAIGAGGGLLAGLGLIAIPGVGPVIAAGWLVSMVVGAAAGLVVGGVAGGLVGALTGAGVPEAHANIYAEGVRRGGALVTARVDDGQATRYAEILDQLGTVDIAARGEQYRQSGWSRFDPEASPYTADQIAAERGVYGVPAEGRSFVREQEAIGPNGDPLTPQEQDHDRIQPGSPSPTPLV